MSQPIVFERLDALGNIIDSVEIRVTAIEAGGGGGSVVIPIGSQDQAGILRLSKDAEVTAEQHSLAATASQAWKAQNDAAAANAGVTTVNMRVDANDIAINDLWLITGDISTALAAFLRI